MIVATDKWLTLDELAEYLKLSRTKLYRMAQEGKTALSKSGALWRLKRKEIDEWGTNQRPGGKAPQGNENGSDREEA